MPQTATQSLTLNVNAAPVPLAITTVSLPAAVVGVSYSVQLMATGGTAPYVWSLQSGTLPVGITLDAAGLLSGTATAPGSDTFTVQVTDSGA